MLFKLRKNYEFHKKLKLITEPVTYQGKTITEMWLEEYYAKNKNWSLLAVSLTVENKTKTFDYDAGPKDDETLEEIVNGIKAGKGLTETDMSNIGITHLSGYPTLSTLIQIYMRIFDLV